MKTCAVWDWKSGAPVPDARLVVCAPGLVDTDAGVRRSYAGLQLAPRQHLVVPLSSMQIWSHLKTSQATPALHVRRQADLAALPSLLAVKARRALVVEPLEAIDLCACPDGSWYDREGADLYDVLSGDAYWRNGDYGLGGGPTIALVVIAGFDEPLRSDHVRALVEQCRIAGVPVIVAGSDVCDMPDWLGGPW